MVVFSKGSENEVALRLVVESEPFGRDYFDQDDTIDELLKSLNRVVRECATCSSEDGIERLVAVAVVPKAEYGSDEGYGYGLDPFDSESP